MIKTFDFNQIEAEEFNYLISELDKYPDSVSALVMLAELIYLKEKQRH